MKLCLLSASNQEAWMEPPIPVLPVSCIHIPYPMLDLSYSRARALLEMASSGLTAVEP